MIASAVIANTLFGLWHMIAPIRQFVEGGSIGSMLANIAMLVIPSGLVGFQFALMTRITGSLYMAIGAHFVNNTIVNMLHLVSDTGVDEFMFARITIAQMLSFAAVLLVFIRRQGEEAQKRTVKSAS